MAKLIDCNNPCLGFDSYCWSSAEVLGKLRIPCSSVHTVVTGTWCTDPRMGQSLEAVLVPNFDKRNR